MTNKAIPPTKRDLPSKEELLLLLDGLSLKKKKDIVQVLEASFELDQSYSYSKEYTYYLSKLDYRAKLSGKSQSDKVHPTCAHDISAKASHVNTAICNLRKIL